MQLFGSNSADMLLKNAWYDTCMPWTTNCKFDMR
jgi:hypothetical protein